MTKAVPKQTGMALTPGKSTDSSIKTTESAINSSPTSDIISRVVVFTTSLTASVHSAPVENSQILNGIKKNAALLSI